MSVSTLGQAVPQVNAMSKVLGRALYAGDIKIAGMLHGKVLRSPHPHARIVRIDVSAALALPGVKVVLTGVLLVPVIGPIFVYWISNFPSRLHPDVQARYPKQVNSYGRWRTEDDEPESKDRRT